MCAALIVQLGVGVVIAAPLVVENPADAPLVETWQLHEVWRLGGDQHLPDGVFVRYDVRSAEAAADDIDEDVMPEVIILARVGPYPARD